MIFHQRHIRPLAIAGTVFGAAAVILGICYANWALVPLAAVEIAVVLLFYFYAKANTRQIHQLIEGTQSIAKGAYGEIQDVRAEGEMAQLAGAIDRMGQEAKDKEIKLNHQRDEYQRLYELVPCIITVQDKDFKLIGYNQEFSKRFNPQPGDYCFSAYKGRDEKCSFCPVEKTLKDGRPHYSEETAINPDGTSTHWIAKTAPLKNDEGEIIGAMEMSLDVTDRKVLEGQLRQSEKKYQDIFDNIPNPVFLLDRESLEILDCNQRVSAIYGYEKEELVERSFLYMFPASDHESIQKRLKTMNEITNVSQVTRDGEAITVNIWISPSEFQGRKVLLVSARDVTKRLEAELQLIQASKMATLGEMATGIAHELNQPLTVIKTVSSFFMKKIRKQEPIEDDTLRTLAEEVDRHVDRAAKIINHMRQFGRKPDTVLKPTQVHEVLQDAFSIFKQQFKLREIDVVWDLADDLPTIQAEPLRLEQVFINLITNSRDAIEMKWEDASPGVDDEKTINLHTYANEEGVFFEICDSGIGISEAALGKIFEPFYTTKKDGEGTGIGLSISYGIVQEFGGTIQAFSDPGEGACLILRFPLGDTV